MRNNALPYVSEEDVEKAKEFELRFKSLSPMAGVIFVSVHPNPEIGGKVKVFDVRLGLSRRFDESVGRALIRKALEKEIEGREIVIRSSVFRGIGGACRDEAATRSGPLSS